MANKYTKTPLPDRAEIKNLYDDGRTQKQLAEHYGVTQKIVWRWMRDLKIKTRVPKNLNQTGENNSSWKGDDAGYAALHYRVYKAKGKPQKCDECGSKDKRRRYQWASLTGKFHDIDDYKRMCQSCHAKYDNVISNLV